MKEIIEAFITRIKSPVFGYFVFFWIMLNWKGLFYLFISNTTVDDRFVYFKNITNEYSLIILPILFATIMAALYPWINLIFLHISKKPVELRNNLQAESENKLLIKKKELEEARSVYLAAKEKSLIERAKRDEEIKSLPNDEVQERLQKEIETLRKEIDNDKNSKTYPSYNNTQAKLNLAHSYKQMADILTKQGALNQAELYMKQAIDIESELNKQHEKDRW